MHSSNFVKLIRKYALRVFIFCAVTALILAILIDIDEIYIRKFSALLTPVIAVFGGLLAVASFQMNYDKRISELRQPIDELIEEFGQYSRDLQLAGPPSCDDIKAFARRVSIYLDPELGDHVFEFFTNNDMAGQGLAELDAEFARAARKKLEALE